MRGRDYIVPKRTKLDQVSKGLKTLRIISVFGGASWKAFWLIFRVLAAGY